MAEGTGFTGMPPYPTYGMGPPTTALHEATTASEPVALRRDGMRLNIPIHYPLLEPMWMFLGMHLVMQP